MDGNEKLFLIKNVDASSAPYDESGVRKDELSFYAEYRRDTDNKSDLYGGDAYPVVWSESVNGKKYGMILVSDGLGSGSFTHEKLRSQYGDGEEPESDKLYDFLTGLYGDEFFSDEEAVAYALRSFSPRQPDGLYMTPSGKERFEEPFYQRSSQYLASRIVCVGAFYKFRKRVKKYFENGFTAENVKRFRDDLERYIDGESDADGNLVFGGKSVTEEKGYKEWLESNDDCLRKNVWKTFDTINDAYKDKAVYLPCTFACWVFVEDDKNVNAAALFLGDSRCYKIDLKDGVQQISVDDVSANAEHDGAMTVIQTFGFNHNAKTVGGVKTHDGAIKATMVSLDKPCALFCCSDGVYDTCPTFDEGIEGMVQRKPSDEIARFELFREVNDLAFEYNFLNILKNSRGLDDLRQRLVRSFYAHTVPDFADPRGARSPVSVFESEKHSGGVKLDDSATLGISFFSNGDNAAFDLIAALKETTTVLDEIWAEFSNDETKDLYCANLDDSEYSEAKKNALINDVIMTDYGGNDFLDILVKNAMEHYSEIKARRNDSGKWLMYEIPNKAMKSESAIKSVLCKNFDYLLNKAVDEFNEIYYDNFDARDSDDTNSAPVKVDEKLIEKVKDIKARFAASYDKYNAKKRLDSARKELDVLTGDVNGGKCEGAEARFENILNTIRDCGSTEGFSEAARDIESMKNEKEFFFIADLCSDLESNDDVEKQNAKRKADEWLRSDTAIYIPEAASYTDSSGNLVTKRDVTSYVICDDATLVKLCALAEKKSKGTASFSEYFGGFDEMREKIFNETEQSVREPYEAFGRAAKAAENFKCLSEDRQSVELFENDGEPSYKDVRRNDGRKPVYATAKNNA